MKFFKWKTFLVTSAVCLLPILLGILLWEKLPNIIAIHFNLYGEPDNFAPKGFVVFGLPLLMIALQAFCCFVSDINAHKHGERRKVEAVTKWIIPVMTIVFPLISSSVPKQANLSCILLCPSSLTEQEFRIIISEEAISSEY